MANPPTNQLAPLNIVNVANDWAGKPLPELRWTLPGLIPHHQVTMLSGDGGVGKSMLAMTIMCGLATSNPVLGSQGPQIPVLGVFCEDSADVLQIRQAQICEQLGWDMEDMAEVHYLSLVNHPDTALASYANNYNNHEPRVEPLYEQIKHHALDLGVQFVVVDNLYNVYRGNENDRLSATHFINLLRRLAIEIDGSVLLCAHPSRSGMADGSGAAGSTAWHNAVRSRLYLTHANADDGGMVDKNQLTLKIMKMNYGVDSGDFPITKRHGVPVYDPPLHEQSGTFGSMARRSAQRVFLDAMKSASAAGLHQLSPKSKAGNYAPRLLTKYQSGIGSKYDHRQLENAMHNLLKDGYLRVEQIPGSKSRLTETIVLTERGENGYDD